MSIKKASNRIAVIGGGAAGMTAAYFAEMSGADTTLFEKNEKLGRKLGITGKGRCNLTNNCEIPEFIANVPNGSKFLYSALYGFTPGDTMELFESFGVPLKTERGNRVFPVSDRAGDIVYSLVKKLREIGVKIIHSEVDSLIVEDNRIIGLKANGKEYNFDRIILATGGASYPLTGSTGDGYKMASALGHKIVPLKPSLVPLVTYGDIARRMQGLSLKNIGITIKDTEKNKKVYEDFGEMMFTHFGVTGPVILSASSYLKDIKPNKYELHIDMKPALSESELDKRILCDFGKNQNKDLVNALGDLLPVKMIPVFIGLCGISEHIKVNMIDKTMRAVMVSTMKDIVIAVKGTRDISEAIITSGGIDLKEINSSTMESKLIKGLYFAGEIIDADAYTGGFNLQIAFSTAHLAAVSAALNEE